MIAPVALALYAVAISVAAPRLLTRSALSDRAPRLAIIAWQVASLSFLASVVLAGIAVAFPAVTLHDGLEHILSDCMYAIRAHYETPGGFVTGVVGLGIVAAVLLRISVVGIPTLTTLRAQRREHVDGVTLIGRDEHELGCTVIPHSAPAAYCVPGRGGKIVLTTSALSQLDDEELIAVLAHERSHMFGRHHLVIDLALALSRAFPRLRLYRDARSETLRLIELLADDAAVRVSSRTAVATALVQLAAGPTPAGALGAGGSTGAMRVRRLLRPARPLSRVMATGVVVAGIVTLSAPVAIAAVPVVTAHHVDLCSPAESHHH